MSNLKTTLTTLALALCTFATAQTAITAPNKKNLKIARTRSKRAHCQEQWCVDSERRHYHILVKTLWQQHQRVQRSHTVVYCCVEKWQNFGRRSRQKQ